MNRNGQTKLLANKPIWDNDSSWVAPKPIYGDAKCDVCVIGLGCSGLVAINEL